MKTIKSILVLLVLSCITLQLTAQQAYLVHQDNVKPSKIMQYEKTAKAFQEATLKHQPDTEWLAASTNDMKYFYITAIDNMAELDTDPMEAMAKAMGNTFEDLFKAFNTCYDSHGSYIIRGDTELSYMPEDNTIPEGHDYRRWYYIYYTPENGKAVRDGMKAIKAFYKEKNSKSYYRVYRNGFGQMENYYLVSMAAKNEIDFATKEEENRAVLGAFEERWEAFSQLMDYAIRMEEYTGEMRPDLSYTPKKS